MLTLLFFKIIYESGQLILSISTMDISFISEPIKKAFLYIIEYFKAMDPGFVENNSEHITKAISNGAKILAKA